MRAFSLVADVMRAQLGRLADRFYGCSHRWRSFPITLAPASGAAGPADAPPATCVGCLESGCRFIYDRRAMRPTGRRAKALIPLLLLFGFVRDGGAQVARAYQISVNVDLVVLHATVRDRAGGFASGLSEQDFELYEDGVRQSIHVFRHEDAPVTVGLVVDHSSSMRPKLGHVIAAARTFVESSRPDDEMFIVNFNENVTIGLPAAIQFTSSHLELTRAIANTPTAGKTALYDALVRAFERLEIGTREKRVLIVISDGGDNASAHTLAEVAKLAGQSSAVVYTIGIYDEDGEDRNPAVLKRLAGVTGGEALFPLRLVDVAAACERIAQDVRNQYTLAYASNNPPQPGAHRTIRVVAHHGGERTLLVRTRSGYIAGEAAK